MPQNLRGVRVAREGLPGRGRSGDRAEDPLPVTTSDCQAAVPGPTMVVMTVPRPWALVTWKTTPYAIAMAEPKYFATREAALAAAPTDAPSTVVNIRRSAPHVSVDEIVRKTRFLDNPYAGCLLGGPPDPYALPAWTARC